MKKQLGVTLLSLIVVGVLAIGFIAPQAKAATTAELQAQIQSLLAQVQQLQALLSQQGGQVAWCHNFNSNLKIGDSGSEVQALHNALANEGFLDEKFVNSNNFDENTASAVTGFQEKYASEILTSWGLKYGTGFVGATTRAKLNKLYGCVVVQPPICTQSCPLYSPSAPLVCQSGYEPVCVQVSPNTCGCYPLASCSCVPISQNQPPVISGVSGPTTLNQGETGTWTVQASDPEQGVLTYSVVWGDEITVYTTSSNTSRSSTYTQTATFTHSYSNVGNYNPTFTVTDNQGLSAKTSVSVNVGGTTCIGEDGPLGAVVPSNTNVCCSGLIQIGTAVSDGNLCQWLMGGRGYCTKCGDGICRSPENACNCPNDCKTTNCIQVITYAQNPQTQDCQVFSTPCNIPVGWVKVDKCSF